MRKYITFKCVVITVIVLLVAAQVVSGLFIRQANQKIKNAELSAQLMQNALDNAFLQQSLSPLPGKNRLYLAELNLSVPLDLTTTSLRYAYTLGDPTKQNGEVRVTSALITDHEEHVKSCSDMVRLKVEAKPNPYSPDQPLYTTVKLDDGRTLQVYACTTKECQFAWQPMSPQTIAETFKSAKTYAE